MLHYTFLPLLPPSSSHLQWYTRTAACYYSPSVSVRRLVRFFAIPFASQDPGTAARQSICNTTPRFAYLPQFLNPRAVLSCTRIYVYLPVESVRNIFADLCRVVMPDRWSQPVPNQNRLEPSLDISVED